MMGKVHWRRRVLFYKPIIISMSFTKLLLELLECLLHQGYVPRKESMEIQHYLLGTVEVGYIRCIFISVRTIIRKAYYLTVYMPCWLILVFLSQIEEIYYASIIYILKTTTHIWHLDNRKQYHKVWRLIESVVQYREWACSTNTLK